MTKLNKSLTFVNNTLIEVIVHPQHIRKLKSGSEEAFKVLYDQFSQKVYSVAIRFGLQKEEADEVVQDVFIKLWNHRNSLKEDLSINAYLLTITKNTLINRRKKIAYEVAYKKYLEKRDLNSFCNTESEIFYSDFEQLAESFINHLPSQQREIFLLSKKQGLSNKEISEKLSLSLRTVENQVYRAAKKVKEELRKNGVVISLFVAGVLNIW